jgi:zinc protease
MQQFELALDAELERLVQHGVTERELRRAQNIAAVDFWRGVSTIDGKARMLGEYAVMHRDYRLLFDAPDSYQRVTRQDIVQIARQVFNTDRRTVGILEPQQ